MYSEIFKAHKKFSAYLYSNLLLFWFVMTNCIILTMFIKNLPLIANNLLITTNNFLSASMLCMFQHWVCLTLKENLILYSYKIK